MPMNKRQAAAFLGVHPKTVQRYTRLGDLTRGPSGFTMKELRRFRARMRRMRP